MTEEMSGPMTPEMKYGGLLKPLPGLYQYIESHSFRRSDPGTDQLDALHKVSMQHARSMMCSPPASVPLLQMVVRLTNAKKVAEVGVFTGYTTLAMALALPEGGKIYACDITDEYPSIGKPFWEAAGVAGKIDLRIGPAAHSLEELLQSDGEGSFDAGFIDANKSQYDEYYELLLRLLRPGGVIAIDNVIWGGDVLDASVQDADTKAIRALNDKLIKDVRVYVCMLPVSDGVTLAHKK